MIWFPPAKINLGLHVLRKRGDGFHDIETCFFPTSWTDALEIIPSKKFEFSTSGIPVPGNEGENLCLKAYLLLKKKFDLPPVKIHLFKNLPMGAGLGGGSSDAAYTLRGLNEIFGLGLEKNQLQQFAARLGSDCPFFIYNEPMFASGKGDVLEPASISMEPFNLVIVYPEIHVNTAAAYSGINPELKTSLREILKLPVQEWRSALTNDFEKSVFTQFPAIGKIKEQLYNQGAIYTAMSGSGSAVFAFFEEVPVHLKDSFPGYRVYIQTKK